MTRIGVILGSTRPGRNGEAVARWVERVGVGAALRIATVGPQVALSLFTDFEDMSTFRPADEQGESLGALLDDVVAWSTALRAVRLKKYGSARAA